MAATLQQPKHWPRPAPAAEDVYSARVRDREQARLDWIVRPSETLALRVKWQRFYQRSFSWRELKGIRKSLKARLAEWRDVTEHPGEIVTGDTWTAAAERIEGAESELWAVEAAMRRTAARMADVRKTLTAMGEWLEENPDCPDYERRSRLMLVEFAKLAELDGWPSDCPEDRKRLMELAALNGYPSIPSLHVRGSEAGWSCLLASACTVAELRAAMEAIRAN